MPGGPKKRNIGSKRSVRFESFLKQNHVFGFDHLRAGEYPSMSTKCRGLAIYLESVSGWSPPKDLFQVDNFQDLETTCQLRLSLFHLKSKSVFGSTWTSDPILNSVSSLHDRDIEFNDIVYFITRITDPSCICIAEIVLSLNDRRGVTIEQFGAGWTVLNLFSNSIDASFEAGYDLKLTKCPLFFGSPRDLLTNEDPGKVLNVANQFADCFLLFSISQNSRLLRIQRLISENSLIGKHDIIAGLAPKPVLLSGQTKEKLVPCIGFNDVIGDSGVSVIPGFVTLVIPTPIRISGIQVVMPNRKALESNLISFIVGQSKKSQILLTKAEIGRDVVTNRSTTQNTSFAKICRRVLKIGIHNGRTIIGHDLLVEPFRVSETDDEVLTIESLSINGFVEHEYMAIVLSVEYEIQIKDKLDVMPSIIETEAPTHLVNIGAAVYIPSDGKISALSENTSSIAELTLTKLDFGAEIGLSPIYLEDFISTGWTHGNEDSKEHGKVLAMSFSFILSKRADFYEESDINSFSTHFKLPESTNKEISEKQFTSENANSTSININEESDNYSLASSLDLSYGLNNELRSSPEKLHKQVNRNDKFDLTSLLSSSLGLKVNRASSQRIVVDSPQFKSVVKVDNFPNVSRPISRASKSRLHRNGFVELTDKQLESNVYPMDIRTECEDDLLLSDVSILFAGIRFLTEHNSRDSFDSIYCTFQFYNSKPTTTEIYRVVKSTDGKSAVLMRDDSFSRNESPLALRYVIDRSKSKFISEHFANYLASSFFTVDVWNAESLMLLGTCHIPLRALLRQGRQMTDVSLEYDVIENNLSEENITIYENGPIKGRTLCYLQVIMTHIGRPAEKSISMDENEINSSLPVGYSIDSDPCPLSVKPRMSIRAQPLIESEVKDKNQQISNNNELESFTNSLNSDDLMLIFKKFQGDVKGTIQYSGELLNLMDTPSMSKCLKHITLFVNNRSIEAMKKDILAYSNGKVISSSNMEELLIQSLRNLGLSIKKRDASFASKYILLGKSFGDVDEVVKKLLHDSETLSWERASRKFSRSVEVLTLKGLNIEDILSDFDSGNQLFTISTFKEILGVLSGFYELDDRDLSAIVSHFVNLKPGSNSISAVDVCSYLGVPYFGNAKFLLREVVKKSASKLNSFFKSKNWDVSEIKLNRPLEEVANIFSQALSINEILYSKLKKVITNALPDTQNLISVINVLKYLDCSDIVDLSGDEDVQLNFLIEKFKEKGVAVNEVFCSFDLDGNGYLSFSEFTTALDDLKIYNSTVDWRDKLRSLFSKFDLSGDGNLSLKEFYSHFGADYVPDVIQKLTKIFAISFEKGLSIQNIFNEFDKNGNGQLTSDELFLGLRSLDTFKELSELEVDELVKKFDNDKSGSVSLNEIEDFFSTRIKKVLERRKEDFASKLVSRFRQIMRSAQDKGLSIEQLFDHFDKNKSALITRKELREGLRKLPNLSNLSDENLDTLVSRIDQSRDGNISLTEFIIFVNGDTEQNTSSEYVNTRNNAETKNSGLNLENKLIKDIKPYNPFESDSDEGYVFSNNLELKSVEKKLYSIGKLLSSKGHDLENAFLMYDQKREGRIRRIDFVNTLVKLGISIIDNSNWKSNENFNERSLQLQQIRRIKGANVKVGNLQNQRKDDLKDVFRQNNLDSKRKIQKEKLLKKVLSQALASKISIYPGFGETSFFELNFSNPFNHDERFIIIIDNPSVRIITQKEEWLQFREINNKQIRDVANMDEEVFDQDSKGNKQLFLIPHENFQVPFAFYSSNFSEFFISQDENSQRIITINICSGTYGHIVSTVKVYVHFQNCIVHRTLRFFEPEQSLLKKSISLIHKRSVDINSPCKSRFIMCFDSDSASEQGNRLVFEWNTLQTLQSNITSILFRYKCKLYPERGNFYILVYSDPYRIQLTEVWKVVLHSYQRIDSHGNLGGNAKLEFLVKGDSYNRRSKIYTSAADRIHFTPRGIFNLTSNNYHRLSADNFLLSLGSRKILVHLIDVDSRELISSWVVRIVATSPVADIREYSVELSSEDTLKKILFKNLWNFNRKLNLLSSNTLCMIPRDSKLEVPANGETYIRLKFSRKSEIIDPIFLFVIDETGSCEECFQFNCL